MHKVQKTELRTRQNSEEIDLTALAVVFISE
jgi:hypothetical protein